MRGAEGTRIWWQSFTDPEADGAYFGRLGGYLRSVASPGCEVEVFGMQPGSRYPLPVALAAAETAIGLSRLNGTGTSRRAAYALPPGEAATEFRDDFTNGRP